MPVPVPDVAALAALSAHFDLGLSEAELEEFAPAVAATFASSEAVEALYAQTVPAVPERAWAPGEHPLGAWYVTTDITDPDAGGGPLAGRRVAVKDNVSVAGVPLMNGSATVEGFVPRRDATVVTRLLAAGATIAGKSVCEDLCFSGGSFTSQPAPVRNPWDPARNAGGSSSGSGVLVATGEVDLAVGGDQGGSIRIPASFCGIVGHKPTHGLVPYTGAFPIEQTIDHVGPMTRTVADAALMLSVMAGVDGFDPRQPSSLPPVDYLDALDRPVSGMRIAVVAEGFGTAVSDPAVDASVREAVEVLRGLGMQADEVSVPWHADAMHVWNVIATEGAANQMIEGHGYGMNWKGLYDPELIAHYARGRRTHGSRLSKTVKLVALSGRHTFQTGGGSYYAMARNLAFELRAAYDAVLADYDLLVLPTLPYTARELPPADCSLADYLTTALSMIGNAAPFDVTGHPACSVPAQLVDGLPAGLMLVGKRFDDATVLQVAHHYEQALGGFPRPPAPTAGSGA